MKEKYRKYLLDAELFVKSGDIIPVVKVGSDRSGFLIEGAGSAEEALRIGNEAEKSLTIIYE